MYAIIELRVCMAVCILVPSLLKRTERLRGGPCFLNLRLNVCVLGGLCHFWYWALLLFLIHSIFFSSNATPRYEHFDK